MKHLIFFIVALIGFWSCEEVENKKNNDYSIKNEIELPTDSPRGLAYDGSFLWYSDDSLNTLNKITNSGKILKTISLKKCRLTSFDFQDNYIWCINDTTVLHDTTISHYPFSCIYKLSLTGKKLDSILLRGYTNAQRPEFTGLTTNNKTIYGTTNQGYSSHLYRININNKERKFLHYHFFSGLTCKDDTIYCVNGNSVVPLDSSYQTLDEKIIEVDFSGTDATFVNKDLWVCNRKQNKLVKIH